MPFPHPCRSGPARALVALLLTACNPATPTGTGVDLDRGAALFRRCAACHTIGEHAPDTDGPNLHGVVDAPVAERRPRFGYTDALRGIGGTWTKARLDAWLTDPRKLVPGTSMAFPGLPDRRDRAAIIAYLETQGPAPKR